MEELKSIRRNWRIFHQAKYPDLALHLRSGRMPLWSISDVTIAMHTWSIQRMPITTTHTTVFPEWIHLQRLVTLSFKVTKSHIFYSSLIPSDCGRINCIQAATRTILLTLSSTSSASCHVTPHMPSVRHVESVVKPQPLCICFIKILMNISYILIAAGHVGRGIATSGNSTYETTVSQKTCSQQSAQVSDPSKFATPGRCGP